MTGGRLGIYGFGGSAHLVAQVAVAAGHRVHVLTRSADARALALQLGASSALDTTATPPELLDAAILFAPVGTLVPPALAALDRGGTLAVAGIYLSDIPALNYERDLFQERSLRSVTANTRNVVGKADSLTTSNVSRSNRAGESPVVASGRCAKAHATPTRVSRLRARRMECSASEGVRAR